MKQIKMFSGYKPNEVIEDANEWLAEQTKTPAKPKKGKKADAEKAEALPEDTAPTFEHSEPVISVANNMFVVTIVYTTQQ